MTDGPEPKARRHVLEEHLRKSSLPPTSRLVWHVIAGFGTARTGDVTKYPPSLQEIADGAGIERRTAIDHVNLLIKEGWLHKRSGRSGVKTQYRMSSPMDPSPPLVSQAAPCSDATSAAHRTKVVRPTALSSDPGRTKVVRGAAPYPSSPGSPGHPSSVATSRTAADVSSWLGVEEDEAFSIIEEAKNRARKPIKSVGGLIRTMLDNGDLAELRDELRAAATAKQDAHDRQQRESDEAHARAAANQRHAEQAAAQATGPSAEYLAMKATGWKKPPDPDAVPTPEELARIAAFLDPAPTVDTDP